MTNKQRAPASESTDTAQQAAPAKPDEKPAAPAATTTEQTTKASKEPKDVSTYRRIDRRIDGFYDYVRRYFERGPAAAAAVPPSLPQPMQTESSEASAA